MMKNKIHILTLSVILLTIICACNKSKPFDTPFVTITDDTGGMEYIVDKDAHMLNVTLVVRLSAVDRFFEGQDISIFYSAVPGSDLKEGVDYKIQTLTASPVVFTKGKYDMPIRIVWLKNENFVNTGNNSLVVELNSSNVPEMVFGMPGPAERYKKFTFLKK